MTDCEPFNSTVRLEDYNVLVRCYIGADRIYSNVHQPIVYTKQLKRKKYPNILRTDTKPISVLFIVIDSISRLNFIRTMPNTRKFLQENGFIEFVGYNKIDDNTFPNFNALITGLNLRQSFEMCEPKTVGGLDKCPMIWYDFRDSGYVTAYAEDWAGISTYNYLKKGFRDPPTDFYFKPHMEAAETLNKDVLDHMLHCTGPETEAERILHLAEDFTETFKEVPSFSIFWMNTFSHNYINAPTRMDEKVKAFFSNLKTNSIFNNSIIFLLSDHGIRYGSIRKTIQGWYEERLPTNLVSIPPWFQTQYPEKFRNFTNNSKKLTSTYDLYMTLQEVLQLSVKHAEISRSKACPSCTSLFSDIPENRSCKQAGISELWCSCLGKFEDNSTRITSELRRGAIKMISAHIKDEEPNVDQYVTRIILSSITSDNDQKLYLLFVVETNLFATYQALFKTDVSSLKIEKLIKVFRLYET